MANSAEHPSDPSQPHLIRRFGLLQSTALNMSNMIGIGPFITIPALMSSVNGGGPQAMLGWIMGLLIVVPDGMVWSELGAAMPGSGGSYVYLREGFGRQTFGRFMAFLFIWQFILSGPLEIASGYIGFTHYAHYLFPTLNENSMACLAAAVGLLNIALLYRQITSVAKITVSLWVGVMVTVAAVIVTGLFNFDRKLAFDFPPGAFDFSLGFVFGLGAASRIGLYDYLGYYDICFIGDEVKDPGRVIPRSIVLSIVGVALIYFAMNLSIIGVVPWREFVPAEGNPKADFIVALFMERVFGTKVAAVFTGMVLWTAFASCFALLLGYSRVPFAAAQDGYFFKVFGRIHPTKKFPHVSLLVIGLVAIGCSFLPLLTVIDALFATRILVQFIGQIAAVTLLRRRQPEMPRPFRIWLYPLPSLVALAGWIFVFGTTPKTLIVQGLAMLVFGAVFFLIWSRRTGRWPFEKPRNPDMRAAI